MSGDAKPGGDAKPAPAPATGGGKGPDTMKLWGLGILFVFLVFSGAFERLMDLAARGLSLVQMHMGLFLAVLVAFFIYKAKKAGGKDHH